MRMDAKLLQAYLMGGIDEERAKAWRARKGYKDDAKPRNDETEVEPLDPSDIDPPNENESESKVVDGKLHLYVQGMICSGWIAEIIEWFGDICCNVDECVKTLQDNPDVDVVLHIDSPGGVIYDGARLRAALQGRQANGKQIKAIIEGEATSMACCIALVADRILMEAYAVIQFHTPVSSVGFSDARELHRVARQLEAWEVVMAEAYTNRTGENTQSFLNQLRRDGLLPYTSKEAAKINLCDKVMDGKGEDADADPAKNAPPAPPPDSSENAETGDEGGGDQNEMNAGTDGGDANPPADPPPAPTDDTGGGENAEQGGAGDPPPEPTGDAPPANGKPKHDRAAIESGRTLAALGALNARMRRKETSGASTGTGEQEESHA